MRALTRSALVAGLVAPVALSMAPFAFAGDMSGAGHHTGSDHKGDHKDMAKGCSAPAGKGGHHDGPKSGSDLLAPVLGLLSSTTQSSSLSQSLSQGQQNSTDQSNSLVAPVVQVNPSILSSAPSDNRVSIDNAQGNANSTDQGQLACQVGVGGAQG